MGKEVFAAVAMSITVISYLPYLWSMWRGHTRPQAFSWILWGLLTGIGFAAQLAGGAGPGAWNTGCSTLFCLSVALISIFQSGLRASRTDWIMFMIGLLALPLWYFTSDPIWALVLVMSIDGIAFWLTLKKAWMLPKEELAFSYAVYGVSILFALFAMQHYNVITVVYPVFIFFGNITIASVVLMRRRWMARLSLVGCVLISLGLTAAHACSPDQYRIVAFTPAIGHWQDAEGQETGEQQPTFSGRIASNCRGVGTVEIQIVGRDGQGRQVQQAITTVQNVGPGGAGFDYTSLLPYDARVAGYEASIVRVQ